MIAVAVGDGEVEAVCSRLRALGVHGIEVVAPGGGRRVVLGVPGEGRGPAEVAASLRAEGLMAVTRPDGGAQLEAWLRDTRPVVFGERLSVCMAWCEHDRAGLPGLVELGPGGFGNGRHPTTRQMIELLVERVSGGERVLDIGCGSGILALCALKLGAASVKALDINVEAVAATRRNAELNAMSGRLHASLGPLDDIDTTFDIVVANIARAGIVEVAEQVVARVARGGWLAVGGLSPSQGEQVAGFLRPLTEVERRHSDEWATLVLARR